MAYTYPDKDDAITVQLIADYDEAYWAESETAVLQLAITAVQQLASDAGAARSLRLLDLGCGMGRLFQPFAASGAIKEILGVEPDAARFAAAADEGRRVSRTTQTPITVVQGDGHVLSPQDAFDVILSSHVLQHITREMATDLFTLFSAHLKDNGLLVLTTTYTDDEEDCFSREEMVQNRRVSTPVCAADFDAAFSTCGVLPVRRFARSTIEKMAESAGFTLCCTRCYHYAGHRSAAEDQVANETGSGQDARDSFYLLIKKGKTTVQNR